MMDPETRKGLVAPPPELAGPALAWAEPLVDAAGAEFRALYLYGSALLPDFHPATSDINLLLVLQQLPFALLESLGRTLQAAPRQARGKSRFSPLVLTEPQVRRSLDVFPGEFLDLSARRALLRGTDILEGIVVDPVNLRHQCEFELRSKLVGLRQAFLRLGPSAETAQRLTAQATGGSAALFRHLLTLRALPHPETPGALAKAVAAAYGVDAVGLAAPFAARHGNPPAAAARDRFAAYLDALEALIVAVDELPEA